MRTKVFLTVAGIGTCLLCVVGFAGPVLADTCVILEKQGSLATINCPGAGTRTEELGGRADIYRVGDTIDVSNSVRNRGGSDSRSGTDSRSSGDPRSGRR